MIMERKVLNEAALTKIIAEAMTAVLKEIYEIGDTNRGYDAIRRAQYKAQIQGRDKQSQNFNDYADKLDQSKYGVVSPEEVKDAEITAVNQNNIVFKPDNAIDKYMALNSKGKLLTKEGLTNSWGPTGSIINGVPRFARVSNDRKADARKIAAWCARYLDLPNDAKAVASNWHNWVRL